MLYAAYGFPLPFLVVGMTSIISNLLLVFVLPPCDPDEANEVIELKILAQDKKTEIRYTSWGSLLTSLDSKFTPFSSRFMSMETITEGSRRGSEAGVAKEPPTSLRPSDIPKVGSVEDCLSCETYNKLS